MHLTATPASLTVDRIAAGQLTRNAAPGGPKFPAIAYSFVVVKSGDVVICHDLAVRCWHSAGPGRNDRYVGVAFVGYEPNAAQLRGIRAAFQRVEAEIGRGLQVIEGHRDGVATQCPGKSWPTWRDSILP